MSVHEILIGVMAVFALLGALDRIIGNRFGLGQEFENGILAMGSLGLSMIGIMLLASGALGGPISFVENIVYGGVSRLAALPFRLFGLL